MVTIPLKFSIIRPAATLLFVHVFYFPLFLVHSLYLGEFFVAYSPDSSQGPAGTVERKIITSCSVYALQVSLRICNQRGSLASCSTVLPAPAHNNHSQINSSLCGGVFCGCSISINIFRHIYCVEIDFCFINEIKTQQCGI